jgi:hypothetical protein
MKVRVSEMAALIPASARSIIDLGCGDMELKKILNQYTIRYIPIDQYKLDESIILKDFNNWHGTNNLIDCCSDVCFCSGIFEYIYDLNNLLKNIYNACSYIVGSYICAEQNKKGFDIWVNRYKKPEFFKFFTKNGFVHICDKLGGDGFNTLFLFEKNVKNG